MELNRIVIDNFRNIQHAEDTLDPRINIFTGPNRMGKTNTLLAIYWAMTDVLMDGSSDFPSIKPLSNPKLDVSVELAFDSFTLKKIYREKWTKTRGSNTETMTGHETIYYIDDVKTSITEAKKTLAKNFGTEGKTEVGKFDLLRAVIDPYYVARNDWKTTRKFIIELVGDVTNQDIVDSNPEFNTIAERLEKDGWDTDKTKKYYAGQVKSAKEQVEDLNGKIAGLQMIADVSPDDLRMAQTQLSQIAESIASIKSGAGRDPMVDQAKEEWYAAKEAQAAQEDREREEFQQKINARLDEKKRRNEAVEAQGAKVREAKNKLILFDNETVTMQRSLNNEMLNESSLQSERTSLLAKYHRIEDDIDKVTTSAIKCPNCGFVLNGDDIEKRTQALTKEKEETVSHGKDIALQIQNVQLKIEDFQTKLTQRAEDRKPLAENLMGEQNVLAGLEIDRDRFDTNMRFVASDQLQALMNATLEKKQAYEARAAASANDTTQAAKIAELENQKAMPNQVIGEHAAYETAQKKVADLKQELTLAQRMQVSCEQSLALCDSFIRAKLEAFNKRVETVFGTRIHFTLIDNNIKEGSWTEVCYPSVLDKETPFLNGSGSEQILAGIYIAECIKKKLGMEDLPYIFDECDKLDTKSITNIETNSQIITTKVDDINHKNVELVTR